jgi:hypothetical protein
MNLHDQQVIELIHGLLDYARVPPAERISQLRARRSIAALNALGPIIDRYLAIKESPRLCQVTHAHWEGPMICGNPLPCPRHGGG